MAQKTQTNKTPFFLKNAPTWGFCGAAVVSLGLMLFGGLKAGVDFAGGIVLNFSTTTVITSQTFDQKQEKLQHLLKDQSFSMQKEGEGQASIRFSGKNAESPSGVEMFKSAISQTFENVVFDRVDSIGPQMSKGLVRQSIFAIIFAMFAITIYLIIQFNWHMALSGVLVLLCDITISGGFVVLLGFELNLTLVAAFLTLIGYCINDTVVLYDRIRTNAKKNPRLSIMEVFVKSVKEVIRRSFATSIVTMIGVSGILFFADKSIVHFAWVVIFGIAVGTFGSVYIASSLPLRLGLKQMQKPIQVRDKMFYAS